MAEHGYFHPDRGYWQAIEDPSDEVLESYPEGYEEVPLMPGEYYFWENGKWVEHPPSLEEIRVAMPSLTRFQFRAGFKAAGITTKVIEDAIAAVPDEDEREDFEIFWESSQQFLRMDSFVWLVTASKTPEETDEIWTASLNL